MNIRKAIYSLTSLLIANAAIDKATATNNPKALRIAITRQGRAERDAMEALGVRTIADLESLSVVDIANAIQTATNE